MILDRRGGNDVIETEKTSIVDKGRIISFLVKNHERIN